MKLAEALLARANLKRDVDELEKLIKGNAKVQEGDTPLENADELLKQYNEKMDEMLDIIVRINKTNNQTPFDNGTLSGAISRMDYLKNKIYAYNGFYEASTISHDRYSQKEIKYVRCMDANLVRDRINEFFKELRQLDTRIQGLNWTIDLL